MGLGRWYGCDVFVANRLGGSGRGAGGRLVLYRLM